MNVMFVFVLVYRLPFISELGSYNYEQSCHWVLTILKGTGVSLQTPLRPRVSSVSSISHGAYSLR